MHNLQWEEIQYAKKIFAMAKYVRKMEWKLLHIKHILYMRPFGALKIAPQSIGNKNGTKAVLQGWAAAFVPYMLSFTYIKGRNTD